MIAIVDYGMGNLHSVGKAVERLGHAARITSDAAEIRSARGVILPGVGAFGDAMEQLGATGLDETVKQAAEDGLPLLGICLGMQLLFTQSEEHGTHRGLGLLPGKVIRFQGRYKIPHMGWNRLEWLRDDPLMAAVPDGHAYFVHSYHVIPDEIGDLIAVTDYYQKVSAIVGRGRIYGTQFHPEKSGSTGIRILDNFLKMAEGS